MYFHTALGLWLPEPQPVVLPEDVRKKLTPELLRVVLCKAYDFTCEEIAELENISVHGVEKRLDKVHKLLNVQSTPCAYRVLVSAGILPLI